MLSFSEAQRLIEAFAHSFGQEKINLEDAAGRVLAEDVRADRDYPPFNRSAMDGYAIKWEDFANGMRKYRVVDTIYVGAATAKAITSGECYKIMTGAAVPPGADAVIRREDADEKETVVSFAVNEVKAFQNIAKKGEDAQGGSIVVKKSAKCTVPVMGILASLGKQEVLVEKLPSVAIVTTGNEVVAVNEPVTDVQIRNSNRTVIKTLLKKWNIIPGYVEHVGDDPMQLRAALAQALQADIIIVSGGVSAGDADYVPEVLQHLGVEKLFHKVAIRPGKPFWCGRIGEKMIFALPGNPLSTLATFTLFIQHYIDRCFNLSTFMLHLPLLEGRKQKVKLDEFFPVKIIDQPSGLVPVAINGSGDIRLGFEAQAFALHPSTSSELVKGDVLSVYPLHLF